MSATTARKKQRQPAPAPTTGRGAALYITLGVVLLTLGCAWGLALIQGESGYAMALMKHLVQGLAGTMCPGLPLLLIWAGAKMTVSARHRVSVRDILIVSALYLLALAFFALTATLSTGTHYMDYVRVHVNGLGLPMRFSAQYSGFLHKAYSDGAGSAGGLLGMLIAYPLERFFTRIGGLILVILLMLALLLLLIRLNPAAMIRSLSERAEKRRQQSGKDQRKAQDGHPSSADPAGSAWQGYSTPGASAAASSAQPSWYRAAPIYDTRPYAPAGSALADDEGFYPVQAGNYPDASPVGAQAPAEAPVPSLEDAVYPDPVPAAQPSQRASGRRARAGQKTEDGARNPAAVQAADTRKPSPSSRKPAPVNTAQALDEEDDDLPWDEPGYRAASAAAPASAPAAAKVPPPLSAAPSREKAEKSADKKPAAAPAAQWPSQVKPRQTEPTGSKAQPTPAKADPQPVHTDPAVPLTGERIAITPKRDRQEQKTRLDGTSAPTVRQQSAGWLVPYQAPPMRLLNDAPKVSQTGMQQEDQRRAEIIEKTLRSFGVESGVKQIMHGPSVTQFAIQIAPGVKVSKVTSTADNLALELKAQNVRVEAPIKGTNYIGIEVPNQVVSMVSLKEVLESPEMRNNPSPLLAALGKSISGAPILCDLSKMPHLLIAGATGSGKSVCINSIVCSLLYRTSPEQVRMIMIDPKQVELSVYNPIPHLLVPVISDPRKAAGALSWVVQEMLERYGKFSTQQVRNIAGYNKAMQETNPEGKLPNIVVIIDEMADLMEVCRKDVEESIRRLAALARAAGIYMVLATQRPSVDVITGVIKNNIPSRIAFAVSSGTDSRTIIDINGAEKLMGKGDMLYKPTGATATRVQGCFVSDEEVNAITEHIGSRYHTDYDPNIAEHLENAGKEAAADDAGDDLSFGSSGAVGNEAEFSDLLQQAIEMAVEDGQTSTSMLQRRLRVGYARAGRLIDEMEKRGIISQSEGSKPRKTLITREQYYEMMQGD